MSAGVRAGAIALGILLAATAATAAEQDASNTTPPATMFPKDMWTLELTTSYFHAIVDDEDIYNGVVAGGYYFDDKHAVRVEMLGYKMDLEDDNNTGDADDSTAFGLNLGLRYHFFEYQRLSVFIDGIVGAFYGSRNFPEFGTHFNFNEQLGLGATFRIDDNAHLIGGCRFIHISNARIRGADENPGFDGLGGYFGVVFTY